MIQQPGKFVTIVEVEKEAKESVFQLLLGSQQNVFISPKQEIIDNYLFNSKDPIIVENLITEAPTQKIKNIETATIEKILVDILCDENLFSTFQGNELFNIYLIAFERYNISLSKMKRYAKRRSKSSRLESLLNNTKIWH